jgi:hypothetical protein
MEMTCNYFIKDKDLSTCVERFFEKFLCNGTIILSQLRPLKKSTFCWEGEYGKKDQKGERHDRRRKRTRTFTARVDGIRYEDREVFREIERDAGLEESASTVGALVFAGTRTTGICAGDLVSDVVVGEDL